MNDTQRDDASPGSKPSRPMAMLQTPTELDGYPIDPSRRGQTLPRYASRREAIEASRRFKRQPDGTAIVPGVPHERG